jgi:hypothetical protein
MQKVFDSDCSFVTLDSRPCQRIANFQLLDPFLHLTPKRDISSEGMLVLVESLDRTVGHLLVLFESAGTDAEEAQVSCSPSSREVTVKTRPQESKARR